MKKNAFSLNKSKFVKFRFALILFIFLFASFSFIFSINDKTVKAYSPSFVPASPSGDATGCINTEYEYIIYTSEDGSSWMFDWGDGVYTDWIRVGVSDTFISRVHSWSSYGTYDVKVKYKSAYMAESEWSSPLVVVISAPSDSDGDGWDNELEEAYFKDPNNPNEHPVDTDNDGTADDSSLNGLYAGDFDDDGDGLTDELEGRLNLNSKISNYVFVILIDESIYYLIDTNGDEVADIFYNLQTQSDTNIKTEGGKMLLDFTGDGSWDYVYSGGELHIYKAPFPWLIVVTIVLFVAALVIFILFKSGLLYFYEEEYVAEK